MAIQEKNFTPSQRFSAKHIVDADIIIEVSSTIVYYGFKKPGAVENSESWAIMKEVIDTTLSGIDSKTIRTWAGGNKKFDKNMSKYDTYNYS